jgi:hypothetical protein
MEDLTFVIGSDDSLYQCSTNLVLNSLLLIIGSSDEELSS